MMEAFSYWTGGLAFLLLAVGVTGQSLRLTGASLGAALACLLAVALVEVSTEGAADTSVHAAYAAVAYALLCGMAFLMQQLDPPEAADMPPQPEAAPERPSIYDDGFQIVPDDDKES